MALKTIGRTVLLSLCVAVVIPASVSPAFASPERASGAPRADECGWGSAFHLADIDGPVYAMQVWDDGSGPALYAGGRFLSAGGVIVNNIARWNGSWWAALPGPSGRGVDGAVLSLTVHDDGTGEALYAGGLFDTAGGVEVRRIARWDGAGWSALMGPGGPGLPFAWILTDVQAMVSWDDGTGTSLYVGGTFEAGRPGGIAEWDGSSWSGLGAGVSQQLMGGGMVDALVVWNDGAGEALYVGGDFAYPTAGVARWNGSTWAWPGAVGLGTALALAVWDDGNGSALYAAGGFSTAGGVTVNGIARWSGSSWAPLSGPSGTGVDRSVLSLTVWDDGTGAALYAGGYFTSAGGVAANRVARWDGVVWAPLEGPSGNGVGDTIYDGVHSLTVWDSGDASLLVTGGEFATAGGAPAHHIASWHDVLWSPLSVGSGNGLDDEVHALAVWDDGTGDALYAGGFFLDAAGTRIDHVARWNGISWAPLADGADDGTDGNVHALAVWNDGGGDALFVGGCFSTAGGVTANNVARWDGSAWSSLTGPTGNGVDGCVDALAVWDDGTGSALYAGGYFTSAGGVVVNRIARWDGTVWEPLTGPTEIGVNRPVHALAAWDDGTGSVLYAGGYFYQAGGVFAYYLARWDGAFWSALPAAGLNARVKALAVWGDETGNALYAGGYFTGGGGQIMNYIGKWDGASWSALEGPSFPGMDDGVESLAVWDDGTGEALFAGGWFELAGGVSANSVARWDGAAWSALSGPQGNGIGGWYSPAVYALTAWDEGVSRHLFAGGHFQQAGGLPSSNIGEWAFCVEVFADGFESADTDAWFVTAP